MILCNQIFIYTWNPRYLEECSSTLATTYSSGTPGQDASIVTVDQVNNDDDHHYRDNDDYDDDNDDDDDEVE